MNRLSPATTRLIMSASIRDPLEQTAMLSYITSERDGDGRMIIKWPSIEHADAAARELSNPNEEEARMCIFNFIALVINRNSGWVSDWGRPPEWRGILGSLVEYREDTAT